MRFNIEEVVTITDVNRKLDEVRRKIATQDKVVVLKNNKPVFVILSVEKYKQLKMGKR